MSSDQPTGGPSPAAEQPGVPTGGLADRELPSGEERPDASLVRARGLPLLEALERYAPGSRGHADAAATYAFAIAVELGLERSRCELIREVARLHEVGRLYVPVQLASQRRDQLEPHELEQVEQSPAAAAELARGAGVPEDVCALILATQERYDGLGPGGLRADAIPMAARISRAACTYQEVTERDTDTLPLPRNEPHARAVSELGRSSGSVLDPIVLEALARVVARAGVSTR